ncbi:MAG: patatin-like phospholipase family protein [Firmicutes bacterium]|nr:patatin-like phospholipase family protein [Bacillota bacterium]
MEQKSKKKKLGLALGAGAFRGFCHIGVIEALKEHNIEIDMISGCSMGAIIGGCVAAGISIEQVKEMVLSIKRRRKIMEFNLFTPKKGAVSGKRISAILKETLGDISIEDAKIPFAATAVDFKKGELITFNSGVMRDILRASMSIPGLFRPVSVGKYEVLVDGCVLESVPVDATLSLGADVVVAVDALGPPKDIGKMRGLLSTLKRTFVLACWEKDKIKMQKADIIITPEMKGVSLFGLKHRKQSIKEGYDSTIEKIPQILELLRN